MCAITPAMVHFAKEADLIDEPSSSRIIIIHLLKEVMRCRLDDAYACSMGA